MGVSGAAIRYAVLQNTGRASYVAVDRSDGSISAWLNGCNELGNVPRSNMVLIGIYEIYQDGQWNRKWHVFENTAGKTVDVCQTSPKKSQEALTALSDPDYPTKIEDFEVHGIKGCSYKGPKDAPGKLTCPGVNGIRCYQDEQHDESFDCGFGGRHKPVVLCRW